MQDPCRGDAGLPIRVLGVSADGWMTVAVGGEPAGETIRVEVWEQELRRFCGRGGRFQGRGLRVEHGWWQSRSGVSGPDHELSGVEALLDGLHELSHIKGLLDVGIGFGVSHLDSVGVKHGHHNHADLLR